MHVHDKPERQDSENGRAQHRAAGPRNAAPAHGPGSANPEHLTPDMLRTLQRSIGNTAVARLLTERRNRGAPDHADQEPAQRSTVHAVLRSPGQPIDERTRTDMEIRLGANFSDVRLHTDDAARRSAAELGARAYTSNNHVILGEGGGDPHTLAHELVHVVQQRRGPVAGTANGSGLRVSDPSDRYEREAEQVATRAMHAAPGHEAITRPSTGEQDGAGGPIQRVIEEYRGMNSQFSKYGAAVDRLVEEVAQQIMSDPANVPLGGNGHVDNWHRAYQEYVASDGTKVDLLHANFGYAVEAVVESRLRSGEVNHLLPAYHQPDYQVAVVHTRPDIVITDGLGRHVGWLDITSTRRKGHIFTKQSGGWTTKDYVAEVMYPSVDLTLLSGSKPGPAGAAKRRAQATEKEQSKQRKTEALGQAARKIFDSMTATSNKDKSTYLEEQLGRRSSTGEKLGPATAKALMARLDRENYERPKQATSRGLRFGKDKGKAKAKLEEVRWTTAFGYSRAPAFGTGGKAAEKFLDDLVEDFASLSLS